MTTTAMKDTPAVAEEYRRRAAALIEEAWTAAAIPYAPPHVDVTARDNWRDHPGGADGYLEFRTCARSPLLRMGDMLWTVRPESHQAWDEAMLKARLGAFLDVATLLARRERAALRHRIGQRGASTRRILADRGLRMLSTNGGSGRFQQSVSDIVKAERPSLLSFMRRIGPKSYFDAPPSHCFHPKHHGVSIETLHADDPDIDGLPVATPHPVTFLTYDDGVRKDRIAIEQKGARIHIGLIGVVVPETVLSGARGLPFESLVDASDVLPPGIASELRGRPIADISQVAIRAGPGPDVDGLEVVVAADLIPVAQAVPT